MRFKDYQAAQDVAKLPRPAGAVDAGMLKLGRQSRGMSLTALARLVEMTSHELQWIEHGKLPFPSEKLDALCDALDYPANFFTDPWFADILHQLRASDAQTFACDTHAFIETAAEAVIDPKAEVRLLRQRVRDLERQLGYRGE